MLLRRVVERRMRLPALAPYLLSSVEEEQVPSLGTPSGAVSPLKRRLTRKTSVEEGQLAASEIPLLQEASSPERAAKAQRGDHHGFDCAAVSFGKR